ncbi:MAG TPA: ATP-binding protein, partial [Myxococcota bacterium]
MRERTAALHARGERMRMVLDHVKQGLVIVDKEGRLDAERSAFLDEWATGVNDIAGLIGRIDARAGAWMEVGFSDLFTGVLPFAIVAGQLPRRLVSQERTFELELTAIPDDSGAVGHVLVMISDVSDRVAREVAEAEGKDLLGLLDLLVVDRGAFAEFVDECDALVMHIREWGADRTSRLRDLHTLKGSASLVGMGSLASACHRLEGKLLEAGDLSLDDIGSLEETWSRMRGKIASIVDVEGHIEITVGEHRRLLRDADKLPRPELIKRIEALADEPADKRLQRFAEQARGLAHRLNKDVDVVVQGNGVRFDRKRWRPLWAAFAHLLRNAVDHGVESAEARAAAHKPAPATIALSAHLENGATCVRLVDDGPGIDWDRVRGRARAIGIPADTRADLIEALFCDELSTRETVSETSGRGVGLAAVRAAVHALAGTIAIDSEPGVGTSFTVVVPDAATLKRAS